MKLSGLIALGVLAAQEVAAAPAAKTLKQGHAHGRKAMVDIINGKAKSKHYANGTTAATCSDSNATSITAPRKNIWASLTGIEASSVVGWLFDQPELNLTAAENATSWDNTILLVEVMAPNKSDALPYLNGGCKTAPTRYAHVVLDNRASDEPNFQDILVGPLPLNNATISWEPLTFPYNKNNNTGKVRSLVADDDTLQSDWLAVIGASVADITLDLWNGTAMGLNNDTLDIWGIDPLWQEDGRVIRWDTFWNIPTDDFDAETLLPLGLFFKSDVTGRDPSQWSLEGWLYNDIFYNTTEEFRAAYYSPGFVKLGANVEGDWVRTDRTGPDEKFDERYPPTMIQPAGARYAVDKSENYVEWMGFSFYISFNRDTGMALHDIKFRGERVLYELGLQEALAHYAGNDPVQSGTSYLDTFYGFGPYAFELVPGYDCPAYATYLNSSFYVAETTHTHVSSICLFEYDADFAMQRHSTSEYVSVTKNNYFVVRSVSSVGNYDYTFTYSFFTDGSIAVEVRASGYIQSAYYANNGDYGYQIHDALSGSMHDHVLNFKADFDILGTANTIQFMNNVATSEVYPWSNGKARNTMKVTRSVLETEDDSRFDWAPNMQTQVLVVNQDRPNKFGNPRGYRVLPYTGTAHLTVQDSSNLGNAARWAEHDVMVTRQKDTEPRAVHAYNSQDVNDPPIDFSKFFDGESLVQEDLVLWLNLGMHHVPHTGDLPNTVMTTAHSGIQFMPSNYLEGDASRFTRSQVRIQYSDGVTSNVETFGQKDTVCELDFTPIEPDLYSYTGDVVIRKFPYNPNNPYYETDSVV
ncbi:copper amine oxidase [Ophiostoma piceae UAMH 11346]|uniref:Amine oxidase n=1 Tax=Ophiostoma piceae (strain UAMH 11346) TaxID=1262450 RepID=S3CJP8_OPHP1|nr:copper amine oxidase [Ophiostoma piceae UAMH 11346]